jgi:hypothetical protein
MKKSYTILLLTLLLIVSCQKTVIPNLSFFNSSFNIESINEPSGPIIDIFESITSPILIVRRNATESTADYGVVIPTSVKTQALFFPLGKINASANSGAAEIFQYGLVNILGGVHINNATRLGAWAVNTAVTQYGSSYRTSASINGYAQFKTTGPCTAIGVYDVATSSVSGFLKVLIDNNATLANMLPTAQQFVNNGTLSSSCLTTNGGLLAPTDRLLYGKSPGSNAILPIHSDLSYFTSSRRLIIANNLPLDTHIVRFIITPYSAINNSTKTVRLTGIWFNDSSINITKPGVSFEPISNSNLMSTNSDNNFAFSFIPQGLSVTQAEWLGHSGSQFKSTTSMYKDGYLLTSVPQGNYTHLCNEFKFNITGYCKHSLIGKVSTYSQSYTFTAKDGVKINTVYVWGYPGTATGYLPQLAVNEPVNKATAWEANQNYILNNDDESYKYNQNATAGYIWNPLTSWGILCAIGDTTNLLIQDRSGGIINKLYFRRYNQSIVNINDTIKVESVYKFKKFTNADLELSK